MAKITHIPLPPLEFLEEFLILDLTSPSGLRWKKLQKPCQRKPGDIAGGHSCKGYWKVNLTHKGIKKGYRTHRIILYMLTRIDPGVHQVDHIEKRNNNHSVRVATPSQNGANASKWNKKTSSKYKGVYWNTGCNKWLAKIGVNRVRIHLGIFACELDAAIAYNKAAIEYFGEFAKINKLEE
jgi:hypothetical protein